MNQNRIRNFAIFAHIDHGKSTLADRFLEITSTINKKKMKEQFLDLMDLERERKITIKMQPCKMQYSPEQNSKYILNLIDTPGHIDFSYEVSRSGKAVDGIILLVDVKEGIQAQTLSNFLIATQQGLPVIPVLNKIDLETGNIEEKRQALAQLCDVESEEVALISAKYNWGVEELLGRIVNKIGVPQGSRDLPLSAIVFDSEYDSHLGVVAHIRVFNGEINLLEDCFLYNREEGFQVKRAGVFTPYKKEKETLKAGEIGWIATGIKEAEKVFIGDTILQNTEEGKKGTVFKGYKEPKPLVFANIYPEKTEDYPLFKDSLQKLHLTDPSFTLKEVSTSLGRGFIAGFLGLLHLEIVTSRIEKEYGIKIITTLPTVSYQIQTKEGEKLEVVDVSKMPSLEKVEKILEPIVELKVIAPYSYLNQIMALSKPFRLALIDMEPLAETGSSREGSSSNEDSENENLNSSFEDNVVIKFEAPLSKIVSNFSDSLKSRTKGFGSFSYKLLEWRESQILKLEVIIAGEVQPALSFLVHKSEAYYRAHSLVKKLKNTLCKEQFPVNIQAALNGKIVAKEVIPAAKKDVTAPLYGGDFSRKKKLLVKQRKGKKKISRYGKVKVSPEKILRILKA